MELLCECDFRFLGNAFWDFLMFKSVIMQAWDVTTLVSAVCCLLPVKVRLSLCHAVSELSM